jgi:DNA-binding response OmpR family regulator
VVETTREPDQTAAAGAAGRVLVMDDDVHLADVVSRYLVREGYAAETPEAATTDREGARR